MMNDNNYYDLESYSPEHDARTYYTEQEQQHYNDPEQQEEVRNSRQRSSSKGRRRSSSSPKKTRSSSNHGRQSPSSKSKRRSGSSSRRREHNHSQNHAAEDYYVEDRREEENFGEREYGYPQQAPPPAPEAIPSWRLDPEESLSDWTILVRSSERSNSSPPSSQRKNMNEFRDDDSSVLSFNPDSIEEEDSASNESFNVRYFYVHKPQLAVGARRSEYFARLFKSRQNGRGFDVEDNVSRIELKKSAADAFPALLDFMYSPPGVPVDVTTESAVALRHLATCFGIRQLFEDVTAFLQHDLTVKSAVIYLQEAWVFSHQKLMNAAAKICASHFSSVKLSRLVTLDPHLFQLIVTSPNFKSDSETYCSRLCAYLRCKPEAISRGFMVQLASSSIMPRVAQSDSLFLISVLVRLGMVPGGKAVVTDADHHHNEGGAFFETDIDGLTLYQRSAEAAAIPVRMAVEKIGMMPRRRGSMTPNNGGEDGVGPKNHEIQYMKLPQDIRLDLVERALMASKNPLVMEYEETASPRGASSSHYSVATDPDGDQHKKLKRAYAKKVEKYKQMLAEKEAEIQAYEDELSKFARVPVEHRVAPLVSEYTFREEPEYDQYGRNIYGEEPPLAFPRIGDPQMDGWIYREERYEEGGGLDVRNWPMFYYKAN
jgi:hypothetical protein